MKSSFLHVVAVIVLVSFLAGQIPAQGAPGFSFETLVASGSNPPGPDGFFGLGATVSQEPTIGVTHLENSLKYQVGTPAFVGARTEVVPPTVNDPPGVTHILFDLTLTDAYTGTFADLGVTVFGHALNAPGGPQFGHQVQFADVLSMAPLSVGTHLDQRIDLDVSVGPYRSGESFNDIFGAGPTDLTLASAFQFFISKNVFTPITIYIDNVRFVPEPGSVACLTLCSLALFARRRRRPI